MEQKRYEMVARKIIDLVEGMTTEQWIKIADLIDGRLKAQVANLTIEKTDRLEELLEAAMITGEH
jgi:hypothetical protein